ncbi:MAG: histidine phosphatase family protein [Sphingomonadales bacterium 32-68-7]|nr:MAG: histidine phosphatase family protein [Sphingomonadales bacterium 12-68-11]OYX09023.1 MAG: histidine phosphatase family protein [Sphingomonadales bacterium 32-68-7]
MSLGDFERGLNARGRRGAALMGAHIREHGVPWDLVVSSPAERVKLTLEAARLGVPIRWEPDAYLADTDALIALLHQVPEDAEAVLLAAHNPGLQELIFALVPPEGENALFAEAAEKFPTATFAVLELAIGSWSECAEGCGRLVHFARPRDLDPELGPERVR